MAHQIKSTSYDVLFVLVELLISDSNPERAKSVKKKLPVAVFLAFCCGSMSIVVVKKIRKGIDNRIMIINDLVKQGRFCRRKREEYAF